MLTDKSVPLHRGLCACVRTYFLSLSVTIDYAVFEAKRCLVSAQMEFCFYGRLAPVV